MYLTNAMIIFAILSISTTYFMVSSRKQITKNKEGFFVLKKNKIFPVFGIIFIVAAIGVGVVACLGTIQNSTDLEIAVLIILFLLLSGFTFLIKYINQKVIASDEKVLSYSFFGKCREISWAEVTKVEFNKTFLNLKLSSKNTSIKIHINLIGFNQFVSLMEKRLDSSMYLDATEGIKFIRETYNR